MVRWWRPTRLAAFLGVVTAAAATDTARADDPAPVASLASAVIAASDTVATSAPVADPPTADAPAGDAVRPAAPGNPTPYFSTREGFDANGAPKPAFEAQFWLYLPAVDSTIGLNRIRSIDINVDRPRPSVADVVNHFDFAFTCDCRLRFGDWSVDVNVLYLSTEQKTTAPPVPPSLPQALLKTHESVLLLSPSLGYRVLRLTHVSVDLRAGATYAELDADAEFTAGRFAGAKSYNQSFVQAWMGERIDYYPTPRWRIENTAAIKGIGGPVGWDAGINVTYLVSRWFDVSLGYRASETKRDPGTLPDGALRNVRILLYGPTASLGVRF
jgi:hypothetical protein